MSSVGDTYPRQSAQKQTPFKSWRFIQLSKGCEQVFTSNKVTTTRYSLLNFLPKSLLEQFYRRANVWFLLISILELSASNEDSDTAWSTISPLIFLVLMTLAKDGYLDWKRHRSDSELNSQTYAVWRGSDFVQTASQDIQVGDYLFLQDRMLVPADILLLASGHVDHICYVDKQNLIGSPNLATKHTIKETQQHIGTLSSEEATHLIPKLRGDIRVGEPNPDFSQLEAYIKLPRSPKSVLLTTDNLVLRQTIIHATPWIIGLVVYTGLETKAYLNTISTKKKVSRIERRISLWTTAIIISILALALLLALLNRFYSQENSSFVTAYINFLLLLNHVIPITLFLCMDLVRICQVYFMRVDEQLTGKVDIKSADVNEELGQVEYIFANKSALVFSDRPELSVIVVGEDEFWRILDDAYTPDPISPHRYKLPSRDFDQERDVISTETNIQMFSEEGRTLVTDVAPQVHTFQRLQDICSTFRPANYEDFFECVTLCNNVIAMDNGVYFSPWREDELIVQCARDLGCVLESRTENECYVNVFGRPTVYEVIAFSPYKVNSKLTRILLQRTDEQTGVYYVKGPLGTMANILDASMIEYKRIERAAVALNKRGIRTQVLAKKMIMEEQLQVLKQKFQAAKLAVAHVDAKVDAVFQELEEQEEAIFLGLLGVSDTVAEDTKQAVQTCHKAGVKTWLMSGDTETATLAVAYQSGLVESDMSILHLKALTEKDTLLQELERAVRQYIQQDEAYQNFSRNNSYISDDGGMREIRAFANSGYHVLKRLQGSSLSFKGVPAGMLGFDPAKIRYCLSIDGATFMTAVNNKDCRELLSYLFFCAHSVVCNSFLPLQSSIAIKLVKENFAFHPVTLAIGRTGSAISMLQEADIGVGLQGRDKYTNSASDVVLDKFSSLVPLVFKHGQWNYMRMSKAVLMFIYRSLMLEVVLVWYSLMTDVSFYGLLGAGQTLGFLFLFSLFPIMHMSVLDQHITIDEIMKVPTTYQEGQLERRLCWRQFVRYLILSLLHALILCALLSAALPAVQNAQGMTETRDCILVLALIMLTIVVNLQVTMDGNTFTWLTLAIFFGSILLLWIYLIISNFIPSYDLYAVLTAIFSSGPFISLLILGPAACFVVTYALRSYEKVFHPSVVERLRVGKISPQPSLSHTNFPRLQAYHQVLASLYHNTSLLENSSEDDAYAIRPFTLHFVSKYIETEYRLKYISTHLAQVRGSLLIGLLAALIWISIDAPLIHKSSWFLTMRLSLCGALLVIAGLTYTKMFRHYFNQIALVVILGFIVAVAVSQLVIYEVSGVAAALVPVCTFIIVSVDFVWVVSLNVLHFVLFVVCCIYAYSDLDFELAALLFLSQVGLLLSIELVCGHIGYVRQRGNRLSYKLRYSTEKEVEKSRNILSLLLPSFVLMKVIQREDDKFIAEDQGRVTVIFCDIYDFDTICQMYKPPELTAFLDEIFQQLDDLCQVNGVVKIETVGKTYMACSGLKYIDSELPFELSSVSHARRAVDFAFSILRTIGSIRLKNGDTLKVKIGINSGPVISGVVGKHKPQFSLVGDAVNTASRMCSTIESVNTIQISESTKETMAEQQGCVFETRIVWAKGKGNMNTYIVSEERNEVKPLRNHWPLSPVASKKRMTAQRNSIILTKAPTLGDTMIPSPSPTARLHPVAFSFWPLCDATDDPEGSRTFQQEVAEQSSTFFSISVDVFCAMEFLMAVLRTVMHVHYSDLCSVVTLVGYWLLSGTSAVVAILPRRIWYNRPLATMGMGICIMWICLTLLDVAVVTDYDADLIFMNVVFQMVVECWIGLYYVKPIALLYSIYLILWLGLIGQDDRPNYHAIYFLFLVFTGIVNCWSVYEREKQLQAYFQLKKIEEREIEKNEKLLSQMMPKVVYERLKEDILGTDRHRSITMIFADIVGFTNWSSDKTPQEVVGMLSALFTQFDMLCVEFKVYKVHTIGDCYVVMGYNGETESRDPSMECLRALCMAYSMINVIQEVNERENISLNMRIGVHTGDIIAGITGKDVVRYDIYGPSVLVANKMESNGTAGKVNVSEVTKELLERVAGGVLEYEFNKIIEAKGIGKQYNSYFVKVLDPAQLFQLITD